MLLAQDYLKNCHELSNSFNPIERGSGGRSSLISFHHVLNCILFFWGIAKKIGECIEEYERFEENSLYKTFYLETQDKCKIKIRHKKDIVFEEKLITQEKLIINLNAESSHYNRYFYLNNELEEWCQRNGCRVIDVCSRYHPLIEDTFHLTVIDILTVIDFLLSQNIRAKNIVLFVDHGMERVASKIQEHCFNYHCDLRSIDNRIIHSNKKNNILSFSSIKNKNTFHLKN